MAVNNSVNSTRLSADSRVLYFFEKLSQIPRLSGNEKQVGDLILDIAREYEFECERDTAGNVILHVPASPDSKSLNTVMLTAHMDMVGAQTAISEHDFEKDPVEIIKTPIHGIDGGIVDCRISANDTSLGADDGLGCAFILAMITDSSVSHPALEVIFTTYEETDMRGAAGLDYDKFKSRYICNLDGSLLTSSAAGETEVFIKVPVTTEYINSNLKKAVIAISGLSGGHSGVNAADERGNASELMARILLGLKEKAEYQLIQYDAGGKMATAIPQCAAAEILLKNCEESTLFEYIREMENLFNTEMIRRDQCLITVAVEELNGPVSVLNDSCADNLLRAILLLPNGIIRREPDENSSHHRCTSNVGVVRYTDDMYLIKVVIRSRYDSLEKWLVQKCRLVAEVCGAEMEIEHQLPAFSECMSENFRRMISESYSGRSIETMDGCIECGIFSKNMPDADIVSLPVPYYNPHSTNEYFMISEMEAEYVHFLDLMKRLS